MMLQRLQSEPALLSAPADRLEGAAVAAVGRDWFDNWCKQLPDSFGHTGEHRPSSPREEGECPED